MKYFKLFLIIYLLVFTSCNHANKSKKIQEQDINFIESLKKPNNKDYITGIDSVLRISNQKEGRLALLYLKKGELLTRIYNDTEAIKNFDKALAIFEKIGDKTYISKAYWRLGSTNAYLSNKVLANKQLLIALQYSKEINNKRTEANVYGSLAHTHYLYKDFLIAIEYAKKAIEIRKNIKDTVNLPGTYNNLAIIYKNTMQFEEALEYNAKSLELNIHQNDTIGIAMSYNNIGNVYFESLNDDKNAIKYFLKAIALNQKKQLLNSSPLENLGELYLKNENIKQAKYYYSQALDIENKKSSTAKKMKLNNQLLQISLREKSYEKAIFHQRKVDSLNILLTKKDNLEKLELVENQYKLSISQQNLKQQQGNNRKNRIIFLIVIGLLLLLALSLFQYQKNKKLKVEKEKMYLEQTVLRSQMNPHFIFNVLSSIQNSLMDNDPIKSATYLSKFAKLFRQNFDFINKKTITLRDEIDVLENYVSAQKLRYKDKFDYKLYVSEAIDIDTTEIPPLLLQPFLENAIEHGFKNKKELGKIVITISEKNNAIWYEILDNGKGFDTSKKSPKTHAVDVFKKRLKLLDKGDEKSLIIKSTSEGTSIKFRLKND